MKNGFALARPVSDRKTALPFARLWHFRAKRQSVRVKRDGTIPTGSAVRARSGNRLLFQKDRWGSAQRGWM